MCKMNLGNHQDLAPSFDSWRARTHTVQCSARAPAARRGSHAAAGSKLIVLLAVYSDPCCQTVLDASRCTLLDEVSHAVIERRPIALVRCATVGDHLGTVARSQTSCSAKRCNATTQQRNNTASHNSHNKHIEFKQWSIDSCLTPNVL